MGLLDLIRGLFGSSSADSADPIPHADRAIADFWAWWEATQPALRETVDKGLRPDLIDAMSEHIGAVHPDLLWEFSKGTTSRHALAVTGGGDATLRLLAERWRAAGPGDCETWAFHTTKPALPPDRLASTVLKLGPHQVAFSDVRVGVSLDDVRGRLDVVVWHPLFPELSEHPRGQITFLALDSALGEDAVERWIGAVEMGRHAPDEAVDLTALRERVQALAERGSDDDWIVAEGTDAESGMPCVYALNRGIRRWDHPLCDTRLLLVLPYAANDVGLPADPDVAEVLDALTEDLLEALGSEVAYVGRRTGAGVRLVFLYVDGSGPAVPAAQAWIAQCPRPAELEVDPDPLWEARPGA